MPAAKSRPKSTPAEPKTKSPAKRSRPGSSSGDAATVKAVGTEALASAFPAGLPAALPDGTDDPGVVHGKADDPRALDRFVAAVAAHHVHARETDPPAV